MTVEMKLLVVIPAHNEEKSVGRVTAQVRECAPQADILVVDDGSSDGTARIARNAGAFVVSLPRNLGIGAAAQTGYIFAREMGYDIVVRIDADGQHDPVEIPRLISALLESDADVIVGSRFIEGRDYSTSFARGIGIRMLAALLSLVAHQRVTDPTSGFQVAKREVVAYYADEHPHDYPEPETRVLIHRAGFSAKEIPVSVNPRLEGQSSITSLDSVYYLAKVTLAIIIGLLRQSPQRSRKDHAKG